jgi:hypothetical protein
VAGTLRAGLVLVRTRRIRSNANLHTITIVPPLRHKPQPTHRQHPRTVHNLADDRLFATTDARQHVVHNSQLQIDKYKTPTNKQTNNITISKQNNKKTTI